MLNCGTGYRSPCPPPGAAFGEALASAFGETLGDMASDGASPVPPASLVGSAQLTSRFLTISSGTEEV